MSTRFNNMVCNRCGHIFNIKDGIYVYRKLGNVEIKERRCPQCKGNFSVIEVPEEFDKYLYIDNDDRYYYYPDKRGN